MRGGLFSIGGGLFPSPTVAEKSPTPARKSPTPAEKSPTAIPKRCWTLECCGELEFSSPFMEQWTLDARGVLSTKIVDPRPLWKLRAVYECNAFSGTNDLVRL